MSVKPRGEKEAVYVKPELRVGHGKPKRRSFQEKRSKDYKAAHRALKNLRPTAQEVGKLRSMPYESFLKTPYWRKVSDYVKEFYWNTCGDCHSKASETVKLDVHHVTYAHHGKEHEHWFTDLICLCRRCHENRHEL